MEPSIGIERKQLAFSASDIEKLTTSEGCNLKVVDDKVFNLANDEQISDDEEFDDEEAPIHSTPQSKLERMRKEYIALTINSNRDPRKPGSESRIKRRILGEEEDESILGSLNLDDAYTRIHKRYSNLGKYQELIANKENAFEEILPGRVFKRRIEEGSGPLVTDDCMVFYNHACWSEGSREPFDSSWLRHNATCTDLTTDSILPGLRVLLLTMRKGGWCEAFLKPEVAFGRLGAPPRIPANATVFCVLEVVQIVDMDKLKLISRNPSAAQQGGTTFEDFYQASDDARVRGNHYYEQGQYKIALQRYKSGIRILESITYKDDFEEKRGTQLLLKLYNNSAKAANADRNPRLALAACKQASLIEEMDPKIYWNKMIAWKTKGHLDRALGVARHAMHLFPDPKTQKSFQREADEIKESLQRENNDLKDLYRLMGRAVAG